MVDLQFGVSYCNCFEPGAAQGLTSRKTLFSNNNKKDTNMV